MITLFIWNTAVFAVSISELEVDRFSVGKASNVLPSHWEHFNFKDIQRHTDYRLIEEDGQVVVKAEADGSASGLIRKITIDPKKYPIIKWRWKVANVLKKADIYRKERDILFRKK